MALSKDLVKDMAKAIVEFNNNIPSEDYWAHGEPHSCRPRITVEQTVDIINIIWNRGKAFNAWTIFKHKGENFIILKFDHNDGNKALCAKWLHPIDEQHIRAIAKKIDKHTLELMVDEIKDILYIW